MNGPDCRLCGAELTETFVDLGMSPPCESFLEAEQLDRGETFYPLHVRIFGRHYEGEMRRLYEASVAAAYTPPELNQMLRNSRLNGGRTRVFMRGITHTGIERPALART